MKKSFISLSLVLNVLFSSSILLAQSAPASGGVNVISGGGLKPISPQNKNNNKTPQNPDNVSITPLDKPSKPKTVKKPKPKEIVKEEIKTLNLDLKTLIHTKLSSVGDPVLFSLSQSKGALLPKGALVSGKITQIEKVSKKSPGLIKVELNQINNSNSAPILIQATAQFNKAWGEEPYKNNKEFFLPVGHPVQVNLEKPIKISSAIKLAKLSPTKGQNLSAEIQPGKLKVKKLEMKLPSQLELFVEFPNNLKVEAQDHLKLKIVQINDTRLLNPIVTLDETSKTSDRNKNQIPELSFKLNSADFIRYLGAGTNKIWISTTSKSGKTLEALTEIELEWLQ